MSTVRPTDSDDPGAPLAGVDELVRVLSDAEKPPSAHRVGTEHEKFGFVRATRAPLPFDGPIGIETILNTIALEPGWTKAQDGGRTIALFHTDGSSITLEPGGQFELSGAPVRTIHETCDEVGRHLELLRRICAPLGVGFVGLGFHPTARLDDIPMVPKSRYAVMERYMPRVGTRGLDMMKRTCTVQANFDWANEQDFVGKYRAALVMQPLAAALFANSPFVEGKPSGALSERQRVWADTDAARAGFPRPILDPSFSYARYIDWVLDVPMYFVRRNGIHHDVAGASFRAFMKDGLLGHRATLRDFHDHLTTVFPEVRAKKVLEVRAADGGPWSSIAALPALHKGVLYDASATEAVWSMFNGPSADELSALRADVAVNGFRAKYRGKTVQSMSVELVEIARSGLERLAHVDAKGRDETRYLDVLANSAARGQTPADVLLARYRGEWRESLTPLWDALEFFAVDERTKMLSPCA